MAEHKYIGLQGILSALGGAKRRRGEWYDCTCPAHQDNQPSLSVTEGDKKIILKCHAGCDESDICRALGINRSELYREPWDGSGNRTSRPAPRATAKPAPVQKQGHSKKDEPCDSYEKAYSKLGKIQAIYQYVDENGTLLYESVRILQPNGEKTFRQNRPVDPANGSRPFYTNVPLELRERTIYRMPNVLAAIREGRTVYVVEGEKDVHTMEKMGYCATTNSGGANSWKKGHSERLKGADVVVIPDNDESGREHAKKIVEYTTNLARSLRVVHLKDAYPELKEKGDITDLVEAVGMDKARQMLEALVASAEPIEVDLYEVACAAYNRIPGYGVRNGCICQCGDESDRVLGTFVALPVRELTRDDGVDVTKRLEVAGWAANGRRLQDLYVDLDKFAAMNWPLAGWGLTANIMPGNTVKDKLRSVIISAGAMAATQRTIYTHTGWRRINGQWAYLYHGGCIGAENVEVETEGGLQRYSLADVPEDLSPIDAAQASINLTVVVGYDIAVPLLGLMYLAPLREFLERAGHQPNFVMMLKGGTSTHKTTTATLFLSHFGDFNADDGKPATFEDTANAIRRLAFQLKDMPLLIDDFHPNTNLQDRKKAESVMQSLTRTFGDKAVRNRMNANRTLSSQNPARALGLVTGEELPDTGESSIGRMYVIDIHKGDVPFTPEFTQLQHKARDGWLRAAMKGYIEWLIPQIDTLTRRYRDMFEQYRDKAISMLADSGTNDRAAPVAAQLMIGLTTMMEYFGAIGAVSEELGASLIEDYWGVVTGNARRQAQATMEERPLQMYMTAITEMLESKAVTVLDLVADAGKDLTKVRNVVGYCDDTNYYFLPGTIYKSVVQYYDDQNRVFSSNQVEIQRMLREAGIVTLVGKDGKTAKVKRINGKNVRLLWIPRWHFDGDAPKQEEMEEISTEGLPEGFE